MVRARTQRADLLPQRIWALCKDGHQATVDLRAVPGVGAELVLSVNGELRRARLYRAHEQAELSGALRTRAPCSRRRGGRELSKWLGRMTVGTRVVDAPAALLEHEALDSRVPEEVADIRGVEERDKLAVSQIVQFQAAALKLVDLSGRSLSAAVERPQFPGRTHSDALSSDRISMIPCLHYRR